jgi:hypothetical protein
LIKIIIIGNLSILYLNNLIIQLFINLLNIDYLNLLILIILTYFIYLLNFTKLKFNHLVILLFYFYWYNCNINFFFFNFIDLLKNQISINTSLLNGFLGIHPVFLYVSYSFLIIIFIKQKAIGCKLNWLLLILLFIVIILGSWWAEQELSWNSWWSWDLIELISYIIICIIIFSIHFYKKTINRLFIKYFYRIFIFKFILFLLVVRLNLVSSLHTFIPPINIDQFLNYLFIFLLSITFILFFKNKKDIIIFLNILKKFKSNKINTIKIFFFIITNFIFFIFFIQLYLNFIVNYSITDFLKINLFFLVYAFLILIQFNQKRLFFYFSINIFILDFFVKYFIILFYKFNKTHISLFLFILVLLLFSNLEYITNSQINWIFFLKNINLKLNYLEINFTNFQNYFSYYSFIFNLNNFDFFLKNILFKSNINQLLEYIPSNSFFIYNNNQLYLYKYYYYLNISIYLFIFLFIYFLIFLFKKFYLKKNFKLF